VVRVALFDHINRSVPRRNIHSLPAGVVKQIVSIATDLDLGDEIAQQQGAKGLL